MERRAGKQKIITLPEMFLSYQSKFISFIILSNKTKSSFAFTVLHLQTNLFSRNDNLEF